MSAVAVEITVDVQDFTLAILPNAELINPGTTTELRVEVGSIGGFAGDVDLDLISVVPDGYTVRIPSPRVTAPGSTAIYITAPTDALESSLDVHVRGTSGGLVHDTTGTATVVFGLIPICYETVTGTVIDKESRQPIDGMEVSLTRGFNVRRTTTSTDGSYSFDTLDPCLNRRVVSKIESSFIRNMGIRVECDIGDIEIVARKVCPVS